MAYKEADLLIVCFSHEEKESLARLGTFWFDEFTAAGVINVPRIMVLCKSDQDVYHSEEDIESVKADFNYAGYVANSAK